MITIGVEEEYLLLDPVTGHPVPMSEEVRRSAGLGELAEEGEVQPELLQAQVEVATPVCEELTEAAGHLLRLRHALSTAAERSGCRLAATGAAPVTGPLVPVTGERRYLQLHDQGGRLAEDLLINGMHVHVGMPDRETGVAVLNRIRLWLPTLLAMSANSPFWEGQDTAFASWRTPVFSRWAVSGPPPYFAGLSDYEQRIEALIVSETIADTGQLYWQARLSERFPTLEVRCMDVQLRVDDAVMLAGVVRALAATALREHKDATPEPQCQPELLQAAMWHAARHGLNTTLLDPEGRPHAAGDVLYQLAEHIRQALDEHGDTRHVEPLVHRLLREGTGADRQRHVLGRGGMAGLVDFITEETAVGTGPEDD
ncbi:glutamate--cysteine ligase [Streptomyces sp. NBC_00083]|uniref:carboxylate-amine ligase n=1 Tax=Streptomyces sp. NBC_00083 TaxID=2975647 RepID=UPI0022598BD5|nr:glutamate--cysteine ligase [Streptomyces sp. NBC_00083]MCX5387305.1 glutamate--cysteine ligase [Streptomyces sp. NBC_00083]